MPINRRLIVITILIAFAVSGAGCALLPQKTLTDVDIPVTAGTSYTAYQNSPGEQAAVSFSSQGPWDFSSGSTAVEVKSVLVNKTSAAAYKQFAEAKYAEKVLPSAFTNDSTTYNFTAVTTASLSSYGQSVVPGPDGPIAKTYNHPERLLKFPVEVGDEWTDTITTAEEDPVIYKLSRTVVARGQVKVPAGSFPNCFMVKLIRTAKVTGVSQPTRTIMYFWWAPDVGLVAAIGSQPDETQMYFKQADYVFRLKSCKIAD
jgi:hypothetical protein